MAPTRLRVEVSWVADLHWSREAMNKWIVVDGILSSDLCRINRGVGLALAVR